MENRAFQEEEQSRAEHEYTLESLNWCSENDDPPIASQPDSHVYEDISAESTDSSRFTERLSFHESQNSCEMKNRRLSISGEIDRPPIAPRDESSLDGSILPSSRISANRDDESFSPRLLSSKEDKMKESYDDPRSSLRVPSVDLSENVLSFTRENENSSVKSSRRPNRRRRKKDCKRCRSKFDSATSCGKVNQLTSGDTAILPEYANNSRDGHSNASGFLLRDSLLRSQNVKIYPVADRTSLRDTKKASSAVYPITDNGLRVLENAMLMMNAENRKNCSQLTNHDKGKVSAALRNDTDMRINSIYLQERWYGKESPIFYTDVKEHNPFQRAYSLPTRTHTPTSQNRVNLRRSVRNDPPPHPARLDKHRRGWTLHLARPLKTSGCSSPLVPLLIVVLILLAVAGVALYIVFEPEKLQIIQQYLKSPTSKLTGQNETSGGTSTSVAPNGGPGMAITTTTRRNAEVFTMNSHTSLSFPGSTPPSTETETEVPGGDVNATRYCDDCFEYEVCVALVDEEVPTCRRPYDTEDPTGCAGFCVINKQRCHRLDVDAFRCVEIEHHCLDDEWTCSNTLCIPLKKRCDGHMNCYDHSDEYNCVCNPNTHFQCGNDTSCLPLEKRCDGKIDCWDATDEINCTLACPLENEFTCSNGECILKARFCDGLADCTDGSDEPHGCQGRCNKHEFTCQNGRCVTKGMKCDGVDDCGDGTDERYCKNRFA